jgi:hypothetical protein
MIRNVTSMEEDRSSRQYYFLNPPGERPLQSTSPASWPGKVFSSDQMLSLVYLYRMYSVLVIPRSTHRVAWPHSGVHSIMMLKSAHPGKGGWVYPLPPTITSKVVVYAPAERADILPISPLPLYLLCGLSCQGLIVVR